MPEITLPAEAGRSIGSSASGRLRTEGKIPGVVYGHGISPIPIAVEGRALRAALHTEAGVNALLNLQFDGQTHLAMARDIQRDRVRNVVIHVDFQVVRRDEKISADVPLILVGEADAVTKADGVVDHQLFTLNVNATPVTLPNEIEIDISALEIGSSIRVGDVRLPEGVTTDVDPEMAIVVGQGPQLATAEDEAEDAADAAAAAEGAEGGGEADAAAADTAGGDGGES